MHDGDIIAWTADLPADFPDGYTIALALFNTGEEQVVVDSSFEAYNLDPATYHVKDAWTGKNLNKVKSVQPNRRTPRLDPLAAEEAVIGGWVCLRLLPLRLTIAISGNPREQAEANPLPRSRATRLRRARG
jgi:hypothetical protein